MGAQQLGSQLGGQEDGGGAVGAADDADGGGLLAGESPGMTAADEGHEHAQLSSSAQQQALGVGRSGDRSRSWRRRP